MFDNLPLFGALFYFWMLTLLVLLFSKREGLWDKLGLCLIFSSVFVSFWTLITPWAGSWDALIHLGELRYIKETGRITPQAHQIFGYFDFPGLQFMMLPIAELCNLSDLQTYTVFTIVLVYFFTLVLFTAFLKLLRNPFHASLGVILSIASSILLGKMGILHPGGLATSYIALFVLLLVGSRDSLFEGWQRKMSFVLLLSVATIEYLFTPFLYFFVILSIYLVYTLHREQASTSVALIAMPLISIMTWEIFYSVYSFKSITFLLKIVDDLKEGRFFLATIQTLMANIGPSYPWWGTVTRLFWWLSIFGFGTFIALAKLPNFRKLSTLDKIWLGGALGAIAVCIFGTLVTRGGVHGGLSRYLWIAPFFIVPSFVTFFCQPKIRKYGLPFLFITLLLFSFPTFLTNHDTLFVQYIFPQWHSAGKLMESIYDSGEDVNFYGFPLFTDYYAVKSGKTWFPEAYGLEEKELWSALDRIEGSFSKSQHAVSLFVFSEQAKMPYWEYLGITSHDLKWKEFGSKLALHNQVYNNGAIRIYSPST
jgi:hypothetical protein